jgi:hypothetical protein
MRAPLFGCKKISVRKRKSSVCWSSILRMSAKEGLFASAFCALRERNVSHGSAGWGSQGRDRIVAAKASGATLGSEVGPELWGSEGVYFPRSPPLNGGAPEI